MSGITQISKEIRAKCPHCHRSLDMSDVGRELFRRILDHLTRGENVVVENFGRFSVKHRKSRRVAGLATGVSELPEYWQIIFRAAATAKSAVKAAYGKTKKQPRRKNDGRG